MMIPLIQRVRRPADVHSDHALLVQQLPRRLLTQRPRPRRCLGAPFLSAACQSSAPQSHRRHRLRARGRVWLRAPSPWPDTAVPTRPISAPRLSTAPTPAYGPHSEPASAFLDDCEESRAQDNTRSRADGQLSDRQHRETQGRACERRIALPLPHARGHSCAEQPAFSFLLPALLGSPHVRWGRGPCPPPQLLILDCIPLAALPPRPTSPHQLTLSLFHNTQHATRNAQRGRS
ncbi:hypothetical protein OH76DRAFT_899875 [Lentinus brumalis]|uniref:Uncharacterized protein n=1 Tax=Lentinus brumalis TaxID=2498619 RepID=A0A371D0Q6_9APHY|nr:hypothetical protein OH76DRAFT_899875 [Polyporus brumalis]